MESPVAGWTASRYKTFLTSIIRGGFSKFPNKFKVLKNAFVEKRLNPDSGKVASFYLCKECGGQFTATNVQVDHKRPVVDVENGFEGWDAYIAGMYCHIRNLQVLCIACHKEKSAQERKARSTSRRKK